MKCPNCGDDPVAVDALSGRCATCSTQIQAPPTWAVRKAKPFPVKSPSNTDEDATLRRMGFDPAKVRGVVLQRGLPPSPTVASCPSCGGLDASCQDAWHNDVAAPERFYSRHQIEWVIENGIDGEPEALALTCKALYDALEKFGEHDGLCPKSIVSERTCLCGLDSLLDAAARRPEPEGGKNG